MPSLIGLNEQERRDCQRLVFFVRSRMLGGLKPVRAGGRKGGRDPAAWTSRRQPELSRGRYARPAWARAWGDQLNTSVDIDRLVYVETSPVPREALATPGVKARPERLPVQRPGKIYCEYDAPDPDALGLELLRWAFLGADPPPDPGPENCGPDPTRDDLDCAVPNQGCSP